MGIASLSFGITDPGNQKYPENQKMGSYITNLYFETSMDSVKAEMTTMLAE